MKWLIVLLMLLAAPTMADLDLNYSWEPPTTGTPVDVYMVQTIRAGQEWASYLTTPAPSVMVTVPDDIQDFQIRVAGIDQYGVTGPYSEPSDPFTYEGPPGQPGKPSIVSIIAAAVLFLAALLLFFRRDSQDVE